MTDARVVLGAEPDVEVDAEGAGDLGPDELAEGLAGDPPDDLALEVALRDRVVALGGPGLPPRLLGGEQGGGLVPVVEGVGGDRRVPHRQAGHVAHHVTYEHAGLAVGRELGPHRGDGGVQVELVLVGEHQQGQRSHGLGVRPDVDDRVALPRRGGPVTGSGGVRVDGAGPQVDDELALDRHRDRRPGVGQRAVRIEVGGKGAAHGVEAVVALAPEFHDPRPYGACWEHVDLRATRQHPGR